MSSRIPPPARPDSRAASEVPMSAAAAKRASAPVHRYAVAPGPLVLHGFAERNSEERQFLALRRLRGTPAARRTVWQGWDAGFRGVAAIEPSPDWGRRDDGRGLDPVAVGYIVDAMLPDGSRLHVVIPDITRQHWSVNIRNLIQREPRTTISL